VNKEQVTFLAALALLGVGIFLAATGWMKEKPLPAPQARHKTAALAGAARIPFPVFAAEEEATVLGPSLRNPFRAKTEFEDLPLPDLPAPPLTVLKRVSPGPIPGLGFTNLRALEEAVPEAKIEFKASPAEGEDEGEEGGGDEGGGRRRW
jgi:hypothetical protein